MNIWVILVQDAVPIIKQTSQTVQQPKYYSTPGTVPTNGLSSAMDNNIDK
jgi:hypothetical protein